MVLYLVSVGNVGVMRDLLSEHVQDSDSKDEADESQVDGREVWHVVFVGDGLSPERQGEREKREGTQQHLIIRVTMVRSGGDHS